VGDALKVEKGTMKDQRIENCLRANQYTFRYTAAYKLDRINMKEADQNPARLTRRYDEEHMLQMACRMEMGVEFPGIVVCDVGGAEDELSTGYHRIKAARFCGQTIFPAYIVVEPDAYRRAILPVLLNTIEGKSPSRTDIFMTIMDLVQRFPGTKAVDLCAIYGVKEDSFLTWRRLEAATERARSLGVGGAFTSKLLTQKLREEIGRITNDNVFVGVTEVLALTKNMTSQSADEFVRSIRRKGTTELVAQRMIEQRRKDSIEEDARRKQEDVRTPSSTSTKYMSRVMSLLRFRRSFSVATLQLAGIPPSKRRISLASVRSLIEQLEEVAEALDHLVGQTEKEEEWRTKAASTRSGEANFAHI
jgi:hypothetical protein